MAAHRSYLSAHFMRQPRVPPGAEEAGSDEAPKEVIELNAALAADALNDVTSYTTRRDLTAAGSGSRTRRCRNLVCKPERWTPT